MKQITSYGLNKLLRQGVLRNTRRGYVNKKGYHVGFSRTVHKRYIEDYYADLANN